MVMEVMLGKRNSFASENFFNFNSLRVFRDLRDFFEKNNFSKFKKFLYTYGEKEIIEETTNQI